MDNEACNACMLLELKAVVEKLASAKTDEEAEAIQKLALELIEACQCQDNVAKTAKWAHLKSRLPT